MIQEAKHRVDNHKLPQTVVVAVRLARPGPGINAICEQVQLVNYANEVYAPAKRYLHDILLNQLMSSMQMLQAFEVFHPARAWAVQVSDQHID
jgi:hypothetical protein